MNLRFYRRMLMVMGGFLLTLGLGTLGLGGSGFGLSLLAGGELRPAVAQAQPAPAEPEPEIRALPLAEFSLLNLSPQLEAFIPEYLGESRHPQDTRGTIGEDDRIELLSRRYPWSAIGRIVAEDTNGMFGICSGTLIAADVVLTNAHCVMNPETGVLHRAIQFQPNVVNETVRDVADVANVEAVFYGTDFSTDKIPPNADDWAFLQLDRPLGDRYGTIPWNPIPVSQLVEEYEAQLVMVGYSGDYPRERPSSSAGVHLGCSILGVQDESITHDCDTFGGSSGGPILAWIDDQPYIVGVNSAERVNPMVVIDTLPVTDDEDQPVYAGVINFGVDISRIVEFVEQNGSETAQ
ncbi:trypsin-like serine peptidase [Vacuolonema iberomarrocanum]|uniref:trypsin-like serine peptidase n=1 Tax=Vacuolonema iberomarrocanum TaxID=3454632 RepID=UPI0019FA2AE6|nr:trypsin-like peptidase domain-containing protein [filamentous cyanobacterium LEGE 07170]